MVVGFLSSGMLRCRRKPRKPYAHVPNGGLAQVIVEVCGAAGAYGECREQI